MFKNTFQSGFLSILYSIGSKPLQIWDKTVRNGHIKRLTDQDIQSSVLELSGSNVNTCYISCPAEEKKTLGIKLPFLVMIIKNLKKYFTFEVQVLDDKNVRRRFRASNYQVRARSPPYAPRCYAPANRLIAAQDSVTKKETARVANARTVNLLGVTVNDAGEAVHLHYADAPGRGLEPDPVQP